MYITHLVRVSRSHVESINCLAKLFICRVPGIFTFGNGIQLDS